MTSPALIFICPFPTGFVSPRKNRIVSDTDILFNISD